MQTPTAPRKFPISRPIEKCVAEGSKCAHWIGLYLSFHLSWVLSPFVHGRLQNLKTNEDTFGHDITPSKVQCLHKLKHMMRFIPHTVSYYSCCSPNCSIALEKSINEREPPQSLSEDGVLPTSPAPSSQDGVRSTSPAPSSQDGVRSTSPAPLREKYRRKQVASKQRKPEFRLSRIASTKYDLLYANMHTSNCHPVGAPVLAWLSNFAFMETNI